MKIADIGDIATVHTSVVETHNRIENVLSEIYKINIIPIIIGGDHSITFPAVKALCNNTTGKVGVISFDLHLDLRTYQGIHISSGTPFRRILEIEGTPVLGKNLVQIGLHGFLNSAGYRNFAIQKKVTIFSALEVRKQGIERIMEQALEKASDVTNTIYLSIDMDCLDQSFCSWS